MADIDSTGDIAPDAAMLHQRLVDALVAEGTMTSAAVETAFRTVPRHLFLPGEPLERVYRDEPIVTKWREDGVPISSSSQPAAMAIMLEQLDVRPGHRVLEIGAGTGYNASLLAHVAGQDGVVVTVDIDDDIIANARDHLAAAAIPERAPVSIVRGDGGLGWPDEGPYDRIILTVGAWDIVPAWIEQLAPAGRLLVPLWLRGAQRTVAFERTGDHLSSVSVSNCAFMRLRGSFAGPEGFVPIGDLEDGITVTTDDQASVDPRCIRELLSSPGDDRPTGVAFSGGREAWSGLGLWLSLHDSRYCSIFAERSTPALPSIAAEFHWSAGLMTSTSLALLSLVNEWDNAGAAELAVRRYGPDEQLAEDLASRVRAWDRTGRPTDDHLRLAVYPIDAQDVATPDATVVAKRWHQIVITWG